jgi:hypothetical protein
MSGPTEVVGSCLRVVLLGVPLKPEWSELRGKLTFLKYATAACHETHEKSYTVYAYAQQKLRRVAWMKLFPGTSAVWQVSEFEECEMYREFKRNGLLKTLGTPLRKDEVRENTREKTREKNEKINKKLGVNVQYASCCALACSQLVEASIQATCRETVKMADAQDKIRALEDEVRQLQYELELARNSNRKASEMCADEEAVDRGQDQGQGPGPVALDEEAVESAVEAGAISTTPVSGP